MNNKIVIGVIIGLIVVGGVAAYMINQNRTEVESSKMMEDKKMTGNSMTEKAVDNAMNGEQRMSVDDGAMKSDTKMESDAMSGSELMAAQAGTYKDYSPALAESEAKAGNKVVLFFHAPWCPFCKTADTAFKTNLDKIPKGVTVLKTDYDSNLELRKKYAVTYQHTFVQIDASGNQITKWNSGDIDLLIKNVK